MTYPALSLDSLTLTDTRPADAILGAKKAGFDLVSLWTIAPSLYPRQLLTADMEHECATLLSDTGLGVHSLEAFDLTSIRAALAVRPALELGARLGAKTVLAFHFANPDRAEAIDVLAVLAEQAAQCGLGVNIEPVAMGQTRTLVQARDLIRDAGIAAGLLFDSYHFARVGGCAGDIAQIDPKLIRYVQICDGCAGIPEAEWIPESLQERLYPGDGDFLLVEMLRALPRNIPWAIETPSLRRANNGVTSTGQATEAFTRLKQLLERLDPKGLMG